MINLIPKEQKRKMVRVFYYRLSVLFFIMLGTSMFITFIIILPSYLVASVKNNIANNKLEVQKNEPVPLPDVTTVATIKSINSQLSTVENAEKNKFPFSKNIINSILSEKINGIKLVEISYTNNPAAGAKIDIQGIATSREVLLSFRLALENNPLFKEVDLPISNFIKGANIQFSLSLTPA